ncbi:MAG TPA: NHLP bacteriocin export ABC transporter permease/ATPase subunit, partial [Gemmataceae bacterium]|nr:NHLP bacteriocin export ABC transporter permease/ATPase subunit [Gemmataceae bacterium]
MQAAVDILKGEGAPRPVAGNNPLPLDGPGDVWLLTAGQLDVFAIPPPRNGVPGARVGLFRMKPGGVLFGLGPNVLAVGGPGCQVARIARDRFGELARQPDLAGPLAALLDDWICAVTDGVARGRPPRRSLLLETNSELRVTDYGSVVPERDALWVRQAQGSSYFLGRSELTVKAGEGLFPLAFPGWLAAADKETVLTAATTEAVLGDPAMWSYLDGFHRIILACVAVNTVEAEKAERGRFRRKRQFERRLFETTVSRLADVVAPPDEWEDELDAAEARTTLADDDPLLAACRLVGARSGIPIQAPQIAGERRAHSDPLRDIVRASRVRVRRVRLADDWHRQDNGPLLAFHGETEKPVAALPVGPSHYEIVDPTTRKRQAVTAIVAGSLAPFGYCFYRPFPPGPLTPWGLFRFGVRGTRRRDWLTVFLLGLGGSLLGMFTPVATGWIFGSLIPGAERGQLLLVVLALLVGAISIALFQFTRGVAVLRLEGRMDAGVEAAVWDRLLNLPAPFFRRYTAGDLTFRALGIGEMRQVLTDVALTVLLSFLFSIAYFGLLFYYDSRLAWLACGLFLIAMLAVGVSTWVQLRFQRGVYQVRGRVAGLVLQLITGVARLRLAGAEDRALAVWAGDFSVQKRLAFRARSAANLLAAFNAALPALATAALFAVVASAVSERPSLGAFLAFYAAFMQVLTSAVMMASVIGYAAQVVPLFERAKPILETPPEVDPAKALPGDLSGAVELSHVSFRYKPDGPLVLNDVSIHVKPGEFVAFVGLSGAGKSTILRLLLGFEAPASGSIYYDREDLSGLDKQAVRRQIGVVLQDGKLTPGDIFTNIVGSAPLTLEDAWEAARLAELEDDIHDMPMGMKTVLSEGGGTLSGGQRQRLMIARAVVSRPRILLLDEATSALDNRTQAAVSRSLERLKATRIVVAHRLSTIRNADCIYVMEGGRVVQRGRYEELMQQSGLFADLARRQLT